jgi:thioredoxin reductase (NADPH)
MSRTRSMPPPALVAVDEDRQVLDALEAQLVGRYANDYRIECLRDPDEALQTLEVLRDASVEVALVLVGQSLETSVRENLLDRARQLHPHAKRVLLVAPDAWADAEAARTIRAAMALGHIDHYVSSPAAAFDEVFHEAMSDFLLEWARERLLVPQTVHIVGETWAGRAYELRDVFASCSVPHSFCLADSDEGRAFVAQAGADAKLPLMVLPDGRVLSDPSNAEIAEVAGAPMNLEEHTFDLVIVGSGPAGLSAAVYAASEGLRVLVVDAGGIGGQARSSSLIRNYLGFGRGVSGSRLAEEAYQQAASFGASFLFMHHVTALARTGDSIKLWLADGRVVEGAAVILATGASYRRLGIESLEELTGAGVFYGGSASEAPGLTGKARVCPGWRKLRWAGGASPRALCGNRDRRGSRAVARSPDVGLPRARDRGGAEDRGARWHRGGGRRRRGPSSATRAARERFRQADDGRCGCALRADRSASADGVSPAGRGP